MRARGKWYSVLKIVSERSRWVSSDTEASSPNSCRPRRPTFVCSWLCFQHGNAEVASIGEH